MGVTNGDMTSNASNASTTAGAGRRGPPGTARRRIRAARARGVAGARRQGSEGRRLQEAPRLPHRRRARHQPLHPRRCPRRHGRGGAGRAGIPAAGTCASATPSPIPRLPTPRSWMTCRTAPPPSCCKSRRRARPASLWRAGPLGQALKGVFLHACTIALDARENTLDAVGSLMEIRRAAGIGENLPPRGLQLRPAGRAGEDGHALLPRPALLRDRRQAGRRLPHHVARHRADRRRPPLPRGRRQRGPGAGGHAGDLGRLPARLRDDGVAPAHGAGADRGGAGGGCRPVPHHGQAARGAPAGGARGGGLRGGLGGGKDAIRRPHLRAHDGPARPVV